MNSGTYTESLPCGGKLSVTEEWWEIEYYFSGPDNRYNGEFFRVPGIQISEYIEAYEKNWDQYQSLKKTLPQAGEFSTKGHLGMSIRIGFSEGVCITSYHMPISSHQELDQVLRGYRYAMTRAPEIQRMLKSL